MHEDEYTRTQSTLTEECKLDTQGEHGNKMWKKTRSLRNEVFVFFTLYIPRHVLHVEDTNL